MTKSTEHSGGVAVVIVAASAENMPGSRKPAATEQFAGRPLIAHVVAAVDTLEPGTLYVLGDRAKLEGALGHDGVVWGRAVVPQPFESLASRVFDLPSAGVLLWVDAELPLVSTDTLADLVEAAPRTGLAQAEARNSDVFAVDLRALASGTIDEAEVSLVRPVSADELLPVRDKSTLVRCERDYFRRRAEELSSRGLLIRDPARIELCGDLEFGHDVEIGINVSIHGRVSLGDGVRIGPHCILRDADVGAGTEIRPFSIVEEATIGAGGFVGPYARVRPGTRVGDRVQLGNFVETKNASISTGSRINHLSFVGDAEIGDAVTIGAGTITCNHDGVRKNRTTIGREAYVGSGCLLVAPVDIGEGATIGSGSTITRNAPPGELTLARTRQFVVEGWTGAKQQHPAVTHEPPPQEETVMNDWKETKLDDESMWPDETLVALAEAHTDARGTIQSLANLPMKNVSLITSVKGSLRSNHYHKTDWHYIYMLSGCVDYYFRPTGSDEEPKVIRAKTGDLFFTPPMEDHATVFIEDSQFLALSRNPRDQETYESDVVRVILVPTDQYIIG